MLSAFDIIKKPIITEKATSLKDKENKFVFIVAKKANKSQIKNAIEDMFKVDVENIRTVIMSGKLRRVGMHAGHRPDFKKAIVKIKKGQTIKIVEGV
ncbi:MAG: 50S ribosomal protein L23 [Elusimicrobia bacterium]|nr:50S ribosomal protein L23 [Elusimicrobiota bacterium]